MKKNKKLKCKWEDEDGKKLCLHSEKHSDEPCKGYNCVYYEPIAKKSN